MVNIDVSKNSALEPGLHTKISELELAVSPDFQHEVDSFEKIDRPALPFVNQDKTFINVLRGLATKFPYVILVGNPGIGKSMIIDYITEHLTGKRSNDELEKIMPEAVPIMEKIQSRLNEFQNREYIVLANLENPFKPVVVPYTNSDHAESDADNTSFFAVDISNFLYSYSKDPHSKIKTKYDDIESFLESLDFEIKAMLNYFYSETLHNLAESDSNAGIICYPEFDKITAGNREITGRLQLKYDGSLSESDPFLLSLAGYPKSAKNQEVSKLLELIESNSVSKYFQEDFIDMWNKVGNSNVKGLSQSEIQELFIEKFNQATNDLYTAVKEYIGQKQINSNDDVREYLIRKMSWPKTPHVDDSTLDEIISGITKIGEEYKEQIFNPIIVSWIDSVVKYFKDYPSLVKNSLRRLLTNTSWHDEMPFPYDPADSKTTFKLPHGRYEVSIQTILNPNYLNAENSISKTISATQIPENQVRNLFAEFDINERPPHAYIDALGPFFSSGIIVFDDCFSSFIESLADRSDKHTYVSKRDFLKYLQENILTVSHSGVDFEFEAPKILLGADNNDPFVRIDGFFLLDEQGFRSRIELIQMPYFIKNTPTARENTIGLAYDIFSRETAHTQDMEIAPEVINILLKKMSNNGYLNVEYRNLEQTISSIVAYAQSKDVSRITIETLKDKIRSEVPEGFFYFVEAENGFGGHFDPYDNSESKIGTANGLYVFGHSTDTVGGIMHIDSNLIKYRSLSDKVFGFVDIESDMTDETNIKGFSLATNYIMALLSEKGLMENPNWRVSTHYSETWSGTGGASASTATAISILSRLSGEPIYLNRFFTGTLEPNGVGRIGQIGGTFYKGLVPYKLSQMGKAMDVNRPMYFLFPAENLKDLSRDLAVDAFGMLDEIVCLPIITFPQAYYLATSGPEITEDQWRNSINYGAENLEKTLTKVEYNLPRKNRVFSLKGALKKRF